LVVAAQETRIGGAVGTVVPGALAEDVADVGGAGARLAVVAAVGTPARGEPVEVGLRGVDLRHRRCRRARACAGTSTGPAGTRSRAAHTGCAGTRSGTGAVARSGTGTRVDAGIVASAGRSRVLRVALTSAVAGEVVAVLAEILVERGVGLVDGFLRRVAQ